MGAETHVRGRGRRAPALFEVLALVVLLVVQGTAAGDAVAGRNKDHGKRRGVARDCSVAEGQVSASDQDDSGEGREPATGAIACRDDADAPTEPDDKARRAADHNDSGDAEAQESDDDTEPEAGDDEQEADGADERDDQDPDEADEPDGQEADEAEASEPGEAREEHERQEADEPHEGEQPGDDDEPGSAIGDVAQEDPSGSDPSSPPQSGSGTDSPPADGGDPGSPNPSGKGSSSEPVHWGSNLPDGATTGSYESEQPKEDKAGRPSDPGEADIDAEQRGPNPVAFAGAVDSGYNLEGSFSTAALLDALPSRRMLSARKRVPEVAPFIIAGPASWSNTWGAPRFGPGSLERRHEGQDVFCRYGDPVLANERGYLEFEEGGLGGKVARLHRADGSYSYYAHLSGWNLGDFASGDRVAPGDVIGYCGNSGNAAGSSPHVHFGLYGPDGRAINPMAHLVRWLRAAERAQSLGPLDERDWKGSASADLTPGRTPRPLFLERILRLESIRDAFGDSSAVPRTTSDPRLSVASSERSQLPLALVAIVTLALWGFWSRDLLSSA